MSHGRNWVRITKPSELKKAIGKFARIEQPGAIGYYSRKSVGTITDVVYRQFTMGGDWYELNSRVILEIDTNS